MYQSKQQQQLDQHNQYQYKFQYSLASYCHLISKSSINQIQQQQQHQSNQSTKYDQQMILRRSSQLITFKCFLSNDTQTLIKTIFTHYINLYTPLAYRLLKISQLIYPNLNLTVSSFITQCQQHLDLHRQKLVQSIKQITQIFHNEKQKYMKLIALIVSSAIFKILTLENEEYDVQFQTVFHTVYWQLTGTHSTSQLLKKLLSQTFNGVNFHHYLMNQQPPKVHSLKMAQSVTNINGISGVRESVGYGSNNNIMKGGMNCSVQDVGKFVYTRLQNNRPKERQEISFSKKLMNKSNLVNKQNVSNHLNDSKINNVEIKNINEKNEKFTSFLQKDTIKQPIEWQNFKSNQKDFNFKKDRTVFFQNLSKTRSNSKKPFADFLSSNKKPTFASYLQQKRLQFES